MPAATVTGPLPAAAPPRRGAGSGPGLGGLWVQVSAALVDHGAILRNLVHQRNAGRDIQPGDVIIGNAIEVLDQRAQGVAVRCDHDGFALLGPRQDLFLEVGHEALDNVLQALRLWDLVQIRVAGVVGLGVLGVIGKLGRARVIGTAPCHELVLAVLFLGLGLVQALQRTVVALVEAPVADDRDPVAVGRIQRDIGGADCAAQ